MPCNGKASPEWSSISRRSGIASPLGLFQDSLENYRGSLSAILQYALPQLTSRSSFSSSRWTYKFYDLAAARTLACAFRISKRACNLRSARYYVCMNMVFSVSQASTGCYRSLERWIVTDLLPQSHDLKALKV